MPLDDESLGRVTDSTRVIISFGTRKGGFELTNQLRMDIMRRYGQAVLRRDARGVMQLVELDRSFCYLDAVTLNGTPGASWLQPHVEREVNGQKQSILIDEWQSRNEYWNHYYPAAMSHSAVMVYLITRPWTDSKFCVQELAWYTVQCLRMHGDTSVVFLVWEEAADAFRGLLDRVSKALASEKPSVSPFLQGDLYSLMAQVFKERGLDLAPGSRQLEQRRHAVARLMRSFQDSIMTVPQGVSPGATGVTYYYDAGGNFVRPNAANAQRDANGRPLMPRGAVSQFDHTMEFNYSIDHAFEQRVFRKLDIELRRKGILPVPD